MNTVSEKELYANEFSGMAKTFPIEHFIWGEEMVGRKLIIFPKKLKEIQGYQDIQEYLEPCGLVIVDLKKMEYIRCITVSLDTRSGSVYLPEEAFRAVWNPLKASVRLGIRIAAERGYPCDIRRPEEIVDLSHLQRKGSIPYIKGREILYRVREITEEERFKNSRKQSLLDNPKMNYYYSSAGGYFHDKECEEVKSIEAELFCAAEEMPEDREICPKCRRKIYFRKACMPNAKQIPVCDRFFKKYHVGNDQLRHFVMEAGLKFHATSLEGMTVEGAEDTWIIRAKEGQGLQLFHNNYVKTSDTERYITDGFHDQGLEGRTLGQMLRYIEGYTWEKHLLGETAKAEAAKAEAVKAETKAAEAVSDAAKSEASLEEKARTTRKAGITKTAETTGTDGAAGKISWYGKIRLWIRSLFRCS